MTKKLLLLTVALGVVLNSALAEVNYEHVKTPNGGHYSGTFNSNGVKGGFGGGYSSSGYNGGYGGSFGGGSSYGGGGSYGGGYNDGDYNDGDGIGSRGGFDAPDVPFPSFGAIINPGQFEKFIAGNIQNLHRNYASGYSMIHATPGANAYASSSLTNNDNLFQKHIHDQAQLFKNIQKQAYAPGAGINYAHASGSYGPSGIHQTAAVYPENSDSPNINVRFDTQGPSDGKSNFYGVASSSFFESLNVNGMEKHRKGAVTTVNDNGKVTTYKSGY